MHTHQDQSAPMTLANFALNSLAVIIGWLMVGMTKLMGNFSETVFMDIMRCLGAFVPFISLYLSQKKKIDSIVKNMIDKVKGKNEGDTE